MQNMRIKIGNGLFYLLLLPIVELDLLGTNFNLQILLALLVFILAHQGKKVNWLALGITWLFWLIEGFILQPQLGARLLTTIVILPIHKILDKNLLFKSLEYYLLLSLSILIQTFLIQHIAQLPLCPNQLGMGIALNLLLGFGITQIYRTT